MKLLYDVNMFGEPVKLYLDKKSTIKTKVGGILTFILIISMILCCWFLGNDIIYKRNPLSYTQTNISDVYATIKFTKQTFPLAFSLQDYLGAIVDDPRILDIRPFIRRFVVNNQTEKWEALPIIDLETRNCLQEDFPTYTLENFKKYNLQLYTCLKSPELTVAGYYTERYVQFIELDISLCDYDKKPDFCWDKEKMTNHIDVSKISVNLYYNSPFLQTNNYENPITTALSKGNKYINTDSFVNVRFYIQINYLFIDTGYIGTNVEETSFMQMGETSTDLIKYSPIDKMLMKFSILSSNTSTFYYRKYVKLVDLIANLGGVLKVLTFTFAIFEYYFANVEFDEILINKAFKLDLEKDSDNSKNNSNINKIENTIKSSCNIVDFTKKEFVGVKLQNFMNENKNISSSESENIEEIYNKIVGKRKNDQLILKKKEILKYIFCGWRKKFKHREDLSNNLRIFNNLVDKIHEIYDIDKIVRKLTEFEEFKQIFMSKDQIRGFNLLEFYVDVEKHEQLNKVDYLNVLSLLKDKDDQISKNLLELLKKKSKVC
jgi:hypothetical protein